MITGATRAVIESIDIENKLFLRKGIIVCPFKNLVPQYNEDWRIDALMKISEYKNKHINSMHKYSFEVPFTEKEINGINNIIFPIVKEYYRLNCDHPSYNGGFTIIYNEHSNTKLDLHCDDSLYTITICLENNAIGSEILFQGSKPSLTTKNRDLNVALNPIAGNMCIHLGDHPHEVLPLKSGSRTSIVLWFR